MKLDETAILEILKSPRNEHISSYRKEHNTLEVYYAGGDVASELEKIKNYENKEQEDLRKKLARSTKDLMSYLLNPLNKIFSASGFNQNINIKNKTRKEEFTQLITKLPEGMSLRSWMKIYWYEAFITDPNSVILIELKDKKAYPTYKSTNVIHDYIVKWDKFEYLVLEHDKIVLDEDKDEKVTVYRVIDDEKDALFYHKDNKLFKYENKELGHVHRVENATGIVPAMLPSNIVDKKTGGKKSFVHIIDETLKEYLNDQSVHSIYKYLHGFPIFWSYATKCTKCSGSGRVKNPNYVEGGNVDQFLTCDSCGGGGLKITKDVSDGIRLQVPKDGDPRIAPDIAGYVSPDLETWGVQNDEMEKMKKDMFYAVWGTYLVDSQGVEKTATEAYINSQPIMDRLDPIADLAESIETKIASLIVKLMYVNNPDDEAIDIKYGRRWLIETPDILWNRYIQAKKDHAPLSTLDYLYEQFLRAEYHNDQMMLNRKLKEFHVEPFVHYSLQDLKDTASDKQRQRKILYSEWVASLKEGHFDDKEKDQLRKEFDNYFSDNYQEVKVEEQPQV